MTEEETSLISNLRSAYPGAPSIEDRVSALTATARLSNPNVDQLLEAWRSNFEKRRSSLSTFEAALHDLERWLGVVTVRGRAAELFAGFARNATPILAFLTAVAAAIFGLGYVRFYNALGVSPDEVGLGPAQILGRSVLGTLALALAATFGLFIYFMPLIPAMAAVLEEGTSSNGRRSPTGDEKLGFVALVLVEVAAVGAFVWLSGSAAGLSGFATILAPLLPAASAFLIALRRGGRFKIQLSNIRWRGSDFLTVLLVLAPLMLFSLILTTQDYVGQNISDAQAGARVRPTTFLGMSVVGIDAEPARIFWESEPPKGLKLPACVLYLGRSGGSLALYDPARHHTFHVDASTAVVDIEHERSSCYAPVNRKPPTIVRLRRGIYSCDSGRWESQPKISFHYRWYVGSYTATGGENMRYTLHPYDWGGTLRCRVEAHNALGTDVAYSNEVATPTEP